MIFPFACGGNRTFNVCHFARRGEMTYIGFTQIADVSLFVGCFSPCGRKNNLQKKEKYHAAAG
jgi:hypothetical protein